MHYVLVPLFCLKKIEIVSALKQMFSTGIDYIIGLNQ